MMELSKRYGTWYELYSSIWYMVCTIITMRRYIVHGMYHANLYGTCYGKEGQGTKTFFNDIKNFCKRGRTFKT